MEMATENEQTNEQKKISTGLVFLQNKTWTKRILHYFFVWFQQNQGKSRNWTTLISGDSLGGFSWVLTVGNYGIAYKYEIECLR